ncbi:disintegrin and metalloproteinase domain-containing protein 22 isoform X2 [Aplysia californica]|uniref:Disintegrin and metalloproteinase domain-containing protein 22 isoform X2 n=1 Tax=Aplysia californica TaxID=6500 RepID=A0ABM0K2P4_APLCA|nr:disintegrin and metalloproteinase domain-containing protein 22 isoform X2 [Aplysia californica]
MEYSGIVLVVSLIFQWCNGYESKTRSGRRIVRDLHDQMTHDLYNKVLLSSIEQPKEIVYPKQVEKGRLFPLSTQKHKIRHHGTHEHVNQLTVQITIAGTRYRIKLERNDVLLSAGIVVKHYEEDNQQVLTKTVEHCYYLGHVRKDEWSSVAVSTCNGLKGVIQMHNETYIIQPLNVSMDATEHPHVIFKASVSPEENCGNSQGLWLPFQELHKGQLIKRIKFTNAQKSHLGKEDKKQKLLRIAMVLDKSMYMGLEFSQQHVIQYAVDVANIVDLYYRKIDFSIALTYLEFWNLHNHFTVENTHRTLLSRFLQYKEKRLPKDDVFDAAFFLTGVKLQDDKVGIAIPDSICSDRAVAVIKSGRPFEPQQSATILSHMAGHILGIEHDEDGTCACDDAFGCIMSTEVLGAGGFHSRMFSTCSESDLKASLTMGITSCLWGAPRVHTEFKQTCGNGIVERGEECDCGSPEDCMYKDACCDPTTCLLQPWAQCRTGPCCSNCSYLPSSHMCRPRSSECDVPEFCDGRSWDCPNNAYIEDGHPCAQGKGYCSGGICPTVKEQCQGIWGAGAKGGHDQCFQRFNPTGNFNGHCGKDKHSGSYAKCQHDNILCGLLHCEGGRNSPLYGSDKGFSTTNVNANDIEYECKTVHGPAMMDMPHMGMVQDGTKCGENKVCKRNTCRPLAKVPTFTCPTAELSEICSGHGVCAPDERCFCDHGWESEDCSVKSNITVLLDDEEVDVDSDSLVPTVHSTVVAKVETLLLGGQDGVQLEGKDMRGADTPATAPVTEDRGGISTTLLIIILATVIGGLFMAMGITFLCYRRRSPSKNVKNGSSDKGNEKNSKPRKRRWGRKKKWMSSEEESEMSELPPPPVIVMDPDSAMPEKGILKNSSARLTSLDHRNSSDSNGCSNGDQDSVGPYMYDEDEDAEAEEIRNIFRDESTENLDHLQESASFDFVIPPPPQPPPPQFPLPDYYPSPAAMRKPGQLDGMEYESPYGYGHQQHIQLLPQQQVPTWRTALPPQTLSPPQSRIVKLRNLTDYMQQMNKATIDLSPSPDDPPTHTLSPSTCTSEDVRSSETEPDRMFARTSHSDHSPTSVTSGSTQYTGRPSFGNLSQYILKRNEATTKSGDSREEADQHSILGKHRDFFPQSSEPSNHGPGLNQYLQQHNDLNVFKPKMAPTRDEHPSVDMPPPMNPINIRTIFGLGHTPGSTASRDSNNTPHGSVNGDNSSFTGTGNSKNGYEKSSGYGSEQDPERFSIDEASRSDSHSRSESLSRSHSASPPSYSAVIRTGPNRIQLVPAGQLVEDGKEIEGIQQELNRLLENLPRINAGSFERSPLHSSAMPSTPLAGPLSGSRQLKDDGGDSGTPCIDRSLEEIPAHFTDKAWTGKARRPISVAVQGKSENTPSGEASSEELQSLLIDSGGKQS